MRSNLAARSALAVMIALGVLMLAAAPAAAHKGKRDTLRVVAEQTAFEVIDLGTPGPSLGDEFVFSEELFIRGREAGMGGGVCVIVETAPPYTVSTYHCVATFWLHRGQITFQGLLEIQGEGDMGPWTVAITGGTGKYRGASGEARIRARDDTTLVYRLKFDSHKKKKKKHRKD